MLDALQKQLAEKKSVRFYVRAIPGATKTEVSEILEDESVKIKIAAVPEKGKANAELIKFLAKQFSVSKSAIEIVSGATARMKLIAITLS